MRKPHRRALALFATAGLVLTFQAAAQAAAPQGAAQAGQASSTPASAST